mmetsp:Transcript_20545/g.46616  ORF Transcript_20545/g.46616 Transcript_20545/m.46616 type:complete len:134 (-) Transcript_20545:207-608(-)
MFAPPFLRSRSAPPAILFCATLIFVSSSFSVSADRAVQVVPGSRPYLRAGSKIWESAAEEQNVRSLQDDDGDPFFLILIAPVVLWMCLVKCVEDGEHNELRAKETRGEALTSYESSRLLSLRTERAHFYGALQ